MATDTEPSDTINGTADETDGLTNAQWCVLICSAVLFLPIGIGLAVGWDVRGIADTLADARRDGLSL